MHYDVVIIGASMSGLAAGIRLAYFDRQVCIVEKHEAFGGLNSYYTLGGREFDVGLHAVTNFVPPGVRSAPLSKLLRQLRLSRDDFDLRPQRFSEVHFPGRRLRFTNDFEVLAGEIAREFPREIDAFSRLVEAVRDYDDTRLDAPYRSTRRELARWLKNEMLIDMLLCPLMYYGSAQEYDMDFNQFVTMFKAIFLEGFARPPGGVRTIIKSLVKKFRACGGKLLMRHGVQKIKIEAGRVERLVLETGEEITADIVFSSAGYPETVKLFDSTPAQAATPEPGCLSFVETIGILDKKPSDLGHDATIIFFNDTDSFTYASPDTPVDLRSGVVCVPNNYDGHEDMEEGIFRVTWLANPGMWMSFDPDTYGEQKRLCLESFVTRASRYIPKIRGHLVATDSFTPRTIHRFTGRINGAVYGSLHKLRDGRTGIENLFVCGTDQGFLGIIGAMLSGVSMANLHVLSKD